MRHLIVALALSLVLLVMLAAGAAASYVPVTFNGHVYNYCDHVRPGSANWYAAGCDAP